MNTPTPRQYITTRRETVILAFLDSQERPHSFAIRDSHKVLSYAYSLYHIDGYRMFSIAIYDEASSVRLYEWYRTRSHDLAPIDSRPS